MRDQRGATPLPRPGLSDLDPNRCCRQVKGGGQKVPGRIEFPNLVSDGSTAAPTVYQHNQSPLEF
jgi:hypothetical protein